MFFEVIESKVWRQLFFITFCFFLGPETVQKVHKIKFLSKIQQNMHFYVKIHFSAFLVPFALFKYHKKRKVNKYETNYSQILC